MRLVKETVDHPAKSGSPLLEAEQEAAFFDDLWAALYNPPIGSHWASYPLPDGSSMSLRELWVENAWNNKLFVYNNDALPIEFEMPESFALIDFHWERSDLGREARVGDDFFTDTELAELTVLVDDVLIPWDTDTPIPALEDRYRMARSHEGAALLQMHQQGFRAAGAVHGRHWQRLNRGQVPFRKGGTGVTTWVSLTGDGGIPNPPGPPYVITETAMNWSGLQHHSFPIEQLASYYSEPRGLLVPYDALYSDVAARIVKNTLDPDDYDALVRFFLELSGDFIDPETNGGVPSRRKARYDLMIAEGRSDEDFAKARPGSFPLTRGLSRLATLRRLLEAADYLKSLNNGAIPEFGRVFRTRLYDHQGNLAWPADEAGAPCDGSFLKSIGWGEDQRAAGWTAQRGYQPRYIGMGGSHLTLFALLPKPDPDSEAALPPQSYFWCTATIRSMHPEDPAFTSILPHFAENRLLPTHFSDYADDTSGSTGPTIHTYSP